MGKVKWGGIRLGEEKVYSLLYADDLVLMAENEGEMRSLMERLEKYVELNTRKSKIIRFRKGGGELKQTEWRWKGGRIEEVNEIVYLGYVLHKGGGQESHVEDRIKKVAAIMGQVWEIGKRRF